MRRMQLKMGKYANKTNSNQNDKRLSRDSCLDESNDSGLGPEFNLGLPESNSSSCLEESDVDSSSDSVDSGISCRHRRLIKAKSTLATNDANRTSPTSLYSPYSMMHIETSLSLSLDRKMHIHQKSRDGHDPLTHIEPPLKRRKLLPLINSQEEKPRRTTVHHYPIAPSTAGVLTETSNCGNAVGRNYEDSLLLDLPRERTPEHYTTRNGDHIVALLSPNSHSLSRKRANKKPSLHQPFPHVSKDGKTELRILVQPEEQHRARYMTEGSRGSIKDDKGTGFPTVKLIGYNQPVVLQIFIGCDQGKVQPHLFYQACKVTGKNCTPCVERLIDGTCVIEIQLDPSNDMSVSCDCIGILKERNVDVEQRLPYFGLSRCKKRSTKCRMAFRVNIPLSNGTYETLQITSSPILCTQSPGLPEICKKSLTECVAKGGTDLFIIGKNFQKDARIVFTELGRDQSNRNSLLWEDAVDPEKEYIHQSHLVCCVPPYCDQEIQKPVKVMLSVSSGGKSSEPHIFTYTPNKIVVKEDLNSLNYGTQRPIQPVSIEVKQEWNNESTASDESPMSNMIGSVASMLQPVIMDSIQDSPNGHNPPNSLMNLSMPPLQHLVSSPTVGSLIMSPNVALINSISVTPTVESQQHSLPFDLMTQNSQSTASKEVEESHHDVDLISGINQLATEIVNEQQRLTTCNSSTSLNSLGPNPTSYSQENCYSTSTGVVKHDEVLSYGQKISLTDNVISDVYLSPTTTTSMCSSSITLNSDEKVPNDTFHNSVDECHKSPVTAYMLSRAVSADASRISKPAVTMVGSGSEHGALHNLSGVFNPVSSPVVMLSNEKLHAAGNCANGHMTVSENHLLQTAVLAQRENVQGILPVVSIKCEKGGVQLSTSTAPATGQANLMSGFQQSMTFALSQLSDADLLSMINPNTFDSKRHNYTLIFIINIISAIIMR